MGKACFFTLFIEATPVNERKAINGLSGFVIEELVGTKT
jgi:hypothetical protein